METSVLLLVLLSHFTISVKHSLKFTFVVSSGVPDFPEFSAAVVVDETMVAYCDTKVNVKEDWMKNLFDDNPQHLQRYTYECLVNQPPEFRADFHNLKQRFNQSGGVHILQTLSGCEWDDETGEFNGFNQYGYDGEDFLSFNWKMSTWIAPSPQAYSTKLKWDADKYRENYITYQLTHIFPEWLKMYIHYGKSALMRTVLPSVSLLQKSPFSPVICHATGFYPDSAVLFWRKDGEKLVEDVDHGEILPNHDRTFQMSVDLLKLPSEDWGRYECVFQLSAVKEDLVTKLHKDVIRTNHEDPSNVDVDVAAVIGVSLLILALVASVVGFPCYRQRKATETRTKHPETLNLETTSMNSPSSSQQHHEEEEETLNTEPVS